MRRTPTETDRLTGQVVRATRKLAGETLAETIKNAGLLISPQSLSRIELGEKQLTLPLATKLAAHWNTTADALIVTDAEAAMLSAPMPNLSPEPIAEQEWLGNEKPALFAVPAPAPDHIADETAYVRSRTLEINLDAPLSLADYREQVWIPYLEHRYTTDLKQTG